MKQKIHRKDAKGNPVCGADEHGGYYSKLASKERKVNCEQCLRHRVKRY